MTPHWRLAKAEEVIAPKTHATEDRAQGQRPSPSAQADQSQAGNGKDRTQDQDANPGSAGG